MSYVGDTLLGGRTAQRLTGEHMAMDHISNTLYTYSPVMYTSVDGDIVYQWTLANEWDTLYWFGAVLGDRWYPPGADDACVGMEPWGQLEVLDTGHVAINGMMLRYVDVGYLGQFGEVTPDQYRIIERLGAPRLGLIQGGCIIVEDGSHLRTYADDLFPLYDTTVPSACDDLTLALEELLWGKRLSVYPNPGYDQVRFSGVNSPTLVSVYDTRGSLVLDEDGIDPLSGMDVSALRPGLYTIVIRNMEGNKFHLKWTKE